MYFLLVEDRVIADIQEAADYYDKQRTGLGDVFEKAIDMELLAISKNPFYQIRYDSIRCKPVRKFPYLIHFEISESEKTVKIYAVISTDKNPDKYWLKKE